MSPEQIEVIKQTIKQDGFVLIGKSDAADCPICDSMCEEHKHEKKTIFTELTDGYVFTIGNHENGLPEILLLAGPIVKNQTFSKEQMLENIQEGSALVQHAIQVWNENPLKQYTVYNSPKNKYWRLVEDMDESFKQTAKEEFMEDTTSYYGHTDYDVIVLVPFNKPD